MCVCISKPCLNSNKFPIFMADATPHTEFSPDTFWVPFVISSARWHGAASWMKENPFLAVAPTVVKRLQNLWNIVPGGTKELSINCISLRAPAQTVLTPIWMCWFSLTVIARSKFNNVLLSQSRNSFKLPFVCNSEVNTSSKTQHLQQNWCSRTFGIESHCLNLV